MKKSFFMLCEQMNFISHLALLLVLLLLLPNGIIVVVVVIVVGNGTALEGNLTLAFEI